MWIFIEKLVKSSSANLCFGEFSTFGTTVGLWGRAQWSNGMPSSYCFQEVRGENPHVECISTSIKTSAILSL